eukprot:4490505-Pyramimonas_sp.AAC.1
MHRPCTGDVGDALATQASRKLPHIEPHPRRIADAARSSDPIYEYRLTDPHPQRRDLCSTGRFTPLDGDTGPSLRVPRGVSPTGV